MPTMILFAIIAMGITSIGYSTQASATSWTKITSGITSKGITTSVYACKQPTSYIGGTGYVYSVKSKMGITKLSSSLSSTYKYARAHIYGPGVTSGSGAAKQIAVGNVFYANSYGSSYKESTVMYFNLGLYSNSSTTTADGGTSPVTRKISTLGNC